MDVRDVLRGAYDGTISLPAATVCPNCCGTAVVYPVSAPYPWLYCSGCRSCGYIKRAGILTPQKTECYAPGHDDLPKIGLFIKRLCDLSCSAADIRKLSPLFVIARFNRCKLASLAMEDAPGHVASILAVTRVGEVCINIRASVKNKRISQDPGLPFASLVMRNQSPTGKPLFFFPIDDAMRLHVLHARTCDCVLPVVSAIMPTYTVDFKRWYANICSVFNAVAYRRRLVCIKAASWQDVPVNLIRWAKRIGAHVFLYESLPNTYDVHALLDGIERAAIRLKEYPMPQFAGPVNDKMPVLPLYGDYGVLNFSSYAKPLLRHGDMWYRPDSVEPIIECDVKLKEIILPEGTYRYSVKFDDQELTIDVPQGERIIPAIMSKFAGSSRIPIIDVTDGELRKIALVAGNTKVVWRNRQ